MLGFVSPGCVIRGDLPLSCNGEQDGKEGFFPFGGAISL